MSARNLDKIFKPHRIALVGAQDRATDPGLGVLRNLLTAGFPGVIYVVDPERESLRGFPTYPDIASCPKVPDLVLVCSPPEQVPGIVKACGETGVRGMVVLSGGFRETGESGRMLQQQIVEAARKYDDLRIIGPNSMGIIVPALGLNASATLTPPPAGHLAFISQSRSLANSVLDWAADAGIGFSYFVSIGSKLDVGCADLIDYFATDPGTRAIILYFQSIEHAGSFMSAARAFARVKPIVVYKAGRYAESAQIALSHTGSMCGEDAVYEAAFQRAGIVRVNELDDIFDVAELLASQRLPHGARLAIIGNAGGPAIIAADALLSRGGSMATLEDNILARLGAVLPPVWSRTNPVDLLDGAPPERFAQAMEIVLEDKNVDAVLVIFAAQAHSDSAQTAKMIAPVAKTSRKPVLAAWMGGSSVRAGIQVLNEAGIPTHSTPEQAVRAFMHLVSYSRNLETLYETPRDIPVHFNLNRRKLRKRLKQLRAKHAGQASDSMTEDQAKVFLSAYEIPVCDTFTVHTAADAVEVAKRIGYPVVLKVVSPQIMHKVDVGGVALDLNDGNEVRGAFERIMRLAGSKKVDAQITGVTVQKMVNPRGSFEMILGAKRDPTFGPVIMIGMGGIATCLVRDRALGLPPLNERLARRMLESLRFWPMLQGYRGQPAVNLDRLIEVIIRFSLLVADYPEIQEFDINPLLVTPKEILVLDAAAILDGVPAKTQTEPYRHMAIRPYPDECVRHATLRNDAAVILRPIRPEDEPLWHGLIASSSPESIRFRFRSLFRQSTHQMAIQHCAVDYEREITIVAETEVQGERKLVGVGQMVTDVTHETAEYAVLVPDPWQGQGLGGKLLDYCLQLALRWGVKRVVAETDPENWRMLGLFKKRGFTADVHREEEVVLLEKMLQA